MNRSTGDIGDLELAGLSEAELRELSEFIDPDNQLLPPSDRLPPHTKKKPTGPYDRKHLIDHLKQQAEDSKVGEDYVPFVKKTASKDTQAKAEPVRKKKAVLTEFDDMLDMLDEEDIAELASELGVHSIIDQAQSRGDETRVAANPRTGLHQPGSLYSYQPPVTSSRFADDRSEDVDIEDAIESLQADDPSLTELNLNNHGKIDSNLIEQLIEAMRGNTCLTKLQMANVRFSEDHAQALATEVLRTNTSLVVLNLESNRITRKGIKAIMKAIAENPHIALKELRLANQGGVLGACLALVREFEYFAGGAGAEGEIAKFLEKNKTIVKLGYSFSVPSFRTKVDQYIMRNTDIARKKRASITV